MSKYFALLLSVVLLQTLSGCGTSSSKRPTDSDTPAQTASNETPSPRISSQNSTGSSTGAGSGGSGSGSSTQTGGAGGRGTTGGLPDLKNVDSPADWQRKNFKPRPFKHFKHMDGYSQVARMQVQPSSATNRKSGKELFQQACVYCHGLDGKPLRTDPSLTRYNMADLSRPHLYKYGSSPKALYRSIAFGVPAPPMGHFKEVYSKQQIWDLVNYIQSIQRK